MRRITAPALRAKSGGARKHSPTHRHRPKAPAFGRPYMLLLYTPYFNGFVSLLTPGSHASYNKNRSSVIRETALLNSGFS